MSSVSRSRHEPHGELQYRPQLDGLRTLAVYLVVAFHAGLGLFNGGFIGVDLFFVLSGYLVTSILVRDLGTTGRVQRRRFYSRRVRRILPAAITTLLITAFVYAAIATPNDLQDALGGFRAAFLYVVNWYFIRQATDYFAPNVNHSPVLHFWSLAIEEQFYIVWPIVLGGLFLLARRARRWRWWTVRAVVIALGLASALEALHVASSDLDRAYYGTDTRAYQLLVGAAIALTPQLLRLPARIARYAPGVALLAFAGIVLLATNWLHMSPITRGIYAAMLATVVIVALENARGGILKRTLSTRSATYLGKISYGTYLWHWPLIIFVTYNHTIAPTRLFVLDAVAATAIAAISFRFLERPIRAAPRLDRFRGPIIVIGFSTSVLLGLVVVPTMLNSGSGAIASATSPGSGTTLLDWRIAKNDIPPMPDCVGKSVVQCTVVRGSGPRFLLMGDSVARMWIPALTAIAQRDSLTLSVAAMPGCPWQRGLTFNSSRKSVVECRAHQTDFYDRVIPQVRPDVILLAQHSYDDPDSPNKFLVPGRQSVLTIDSPDFEPTLIDMSSKSLGSLRAPHREIVFIEPVPSPPTDFSPLSCLSEGTTPGRCGFSASAGPTPLEKFFRQNAASDPLVKSVDLDALVCPGRPHCAAIIDNIIVWRDSAHITATYSRSLSSRVEVILRKQGIVRTK
jgi:peptidoglycan/LPS O-acetylase OafA/YrhL